MSQLTKSLERRIQQLAASIEAQKSELAAYERVLQMELVKEGAGGELALVHWEVPLEIPAEMNSEPEEVITMIEAPIAEESESPVSGNKTALVEQIVKGYGAAGATPKDVDAYFTSRNIQRSKNLVYNTLSYLVAHKRLDRREGKYFVVGTQTAPKKRGPAKKKVAAAPTKTKRTLSPEGLKRIKEALKKRWALKKAADMESGKVPAKKATRKK